MSASLFPMCGYKDVGATIEVEGRGHCVNLVFFAASNTVLSSSTVSHGLPLWTMGILPMFNDTSRRCASLVSTPDRALYREEEKSPIAELRIAQCEPIMQPDGALNDFGREAVPAIDDLVHHPTSRLAPRSDKLLNLTNSSWRRSGFHSVAFRETWRQERRRIEQVRSATISAQRSSEKSCRFAIGAGSRRQARRS